MEDRFVDLLQSGCDAGIRYEEGMDQDMVAVPIGPRRQRMALAASPGYLAQHGRPRHPNDLREHICLRGRFSSGAMPPWHFTRKGKSLTVETNGPLIVNLGAAADLAVDSAVAGAGVIYLFEEWLQPYIDRGELDPLLEPWWPSFTGPLLYYPGRRYLPAPLHYAAFIAVNSKSWRDWIRNRRVRRSCIPCNLCVPRKYGPQTAAKVNSSNHLRVL